MGNVRRAHTSAPLKIDMSEPDARQLLALLKTSDTFPDIVQEFQDRLQVRAALRKYAEGT